MAATVLAAEVASEKESQGPIDTTGAQQDEDSTYLGVKSGFLPGCAPPTAEEQEELRLWKEQDLENQRSLKVSARALKESKGEAWTEEDESHRWCEDDEDGIYRINATGGWSLNEMLSHPIFMKADCIPQDPRDFEANYPLVAAFRDIAYEGKTPEEMAETFNTMGNDCFKRATPEGAKDALIAYSKALEMECTDDVANAKYYSNRAAASLQLKAYSKCIDDCMLATGLDTKNGKAWFRAAKACEQLELFNRAHRMCCKALELTPENTEVMKVHARLVRRIERRAKEDAIAAERARKQREVEEEKEREVLKVMTDAGIELGPILHDLTAYRQKYAGRCKPRLDADGDLEWPMLFVYEEYSQSDFVEFWNTLVPLESMLTQMFPGDRHAEWDKRHDYVWTDIAIYMEYYTTSTGKDTEYVSIDIQKAPLEYLFGRRIPQCLVFFAFVRGTPCHKYWCMRHEIQE